MRLAMRSHLRPPIRRFGAALSLDLANATLPEYEVVNLFAEYKPARVQGLTVRAEINNLFDSYYISRATQGSVNGRVLAYS